MQNVVYWYDTFMQTFFALIGLLILATLGLYVLLAVLRVLNDRKREEDIVFLQLLVPKKESREEKDSESDQFGRDYKEVIGVMDHSITPISTDTGKASPLSRWNTQRLLEKFCSSLCVHGKLRHSWKSR
jgi:hypothetical protein